MAAALEAQVRQRAGGRCEYCRLPQPASGIVFQIDHAIARHHRGRTAAINLALACVYGNGYKGPNISGLDPLTGKLTRLFNRMAPTRSRRKELVAGKMTDAS
jgi:hypothetical protein